MPRRERIISLLTLRARQGLTAALGVPRTSITCSVEDDQDGMRISLTVPISLQSAATTMIGLSRTASRPSS